MSIQVDHISYTYMAHTSLEQKALDDVSFTLEKGEFVALIGHTGSGKSTLAEHLNGLIHPSSGRVLVDGVDLAGKGAQVKTARGKVGMVFQYPEHQLFAETIYEDVAFGPRNQGKTPEEVEEAVRSALEFVDLDYDTFAQRSPFQLSGGQMRRVAIAGVVAMEPDYLIMDEPSAGLDPVSRDNVFHQLLQIFHKRKMGVLLITHSMEEAAQYADRLLVMQGGKVHLDGPARELFAKERQKLQELSVDIPESLKLADELAQAGLPLHGTPLTQDELVAAIMRAKGWKHAD